MTPPIANPAQCDELENLRPSDERGIAGSGSASVPQRSSRTPLTPTERHQVQEMALIQGLSNSEIGRRMGRDRGTIANVLKADDTAALREQLVSAQRAEALQTLRSNAARMAINWVNAADVAAGKGDHRPSRDLLLHTDVIHPVVADSGPRIAVQINLHGGPEPLSLSAGVSPITNLISIGTGSQLDATAGPASAEGMTGGSAERTDVACRRPSPMPTANLKISKGAPSEADTTCGIAPVTLEESHGR